MNQLISLLPKAELHVHLLGTLMPKDLIHFAKRNKISLPYANLTEIEQAYTAFHDLASFLAIYNQAAQVMQTEQDFYELLYTYLHTARKQGVIHAEIFFEVQTHQSRGIAFQTIISGLDKARTDAQQAFGIQCELILCFIRDLSPKNALEVLEQSTAFKDKIIGIGLAGNEQNNPPSDFSQLYTQAKAYGYKTCIHAGEESGPEYIWQAIKILQVDRISHGIACTQDPQLLSYLIKKQLPLTVCPLSNVKLNLFDNMRAHPLKKMLEAGLLVSINSDDPAFFGSLDENYHIAHDSLSLNEKQLIKCAHNSFLSAFISDETKREYIKKLESCINKQRDR